MKAIDFSPVSGLMESVGKAIVVWQSEPKFRQLYSEADYKTEADRQAHDQISRGLIQLFPSIEIVSEENSSHDHARPSEYWLIDPIDGTASWYHGFSGFVTQAAYIEHGKPLFGVVHAPLLSKTWTAVHGKGAYLNGKRLSKLAKADRLIVTDNSPVPHGISQYIIARLGATGYLESGSLGLKTVLVAEGSADLFVKDVCVRDWDIAPAAVILQEVGGSLSRLDGSPYVFSGSYEKHGGFIVARDQSLLSEVIRVLGPAKNNRAIHQR